MSVDAVGDHIRRSSPGGRSSDTANFEAATYTEYFNSGIATPRAQPAPIVGRLERFAGWRLPNQESSHWAGAASRRRQKKYDSPQSTPLPAAQLQTCGPSPRSEEHTS